MVCEIAQHEAFQKILLKKIEKLKKENNKLKKGIEKLTCIIKMLDQREEVKKLKAENEAKTKVNMFLSGEWKELKTSQSLAETLGLDPKMANDTAVLQFANKYIELKNENEELKKLLNVSLNRGADLRKQVQIEKEKTEDWNNPCPICKDIMGGVVCNTFGKESCGKCSIKIMENRT